MLTKAELDRVAGLSSRKAAEVLHVNKSTINRARAHWGMNNPDSGITDPATTDYHFTQGTDGTIDASTRPSTAPTTLEDALSMLEAKGLDLEAYNVSYGFSEWASPTADEPDRVLNSYRIKATPKSVKDSAPKLDADELIRRIDNYVPNPDYDALAATDSTLVVTPADLQIGKVDYNGGTEATVARVRESIARITDMAKATNYEHIVIAELGDVVENFYNTSSQRETNDLDITGQIRVARRLLLELILAVAPHTETVTYVCVPSNHGTVRVGFKQPAGDSHNDWGIEISHQIEDAVRQNPALDHVNFVRPTNLHESVAIEVSNTKIGFVHGHQARSADKLGEWWKGQSHGRMPVSQADILVSGHWHSFRVQQSGNSRWIMVSPASDNGSAWFTELTGESSRTGMLSFTVMDGTWHDLKIV